MSVRLSVLWRPTFLPFSPKPVLCLPVPHWHEAKAHPPRLFQNRAPNSDVSGSPQGLSLPGPSVLAAPRFQETGFHAHEGLSDRKQMGIAESRNCDSSANAASVLPSAVWMPTPPDRATGNLRPSPPPFPHPGFSLHPLPTQDRGGHSGSGNSNVRPPAFHCRHQPHEALHISLKLKWKIVPLRHPSQILPVQ